MNLNDKDKCSDILATALMSSSNWRIGRDKAFPGDPRNARAVIKLAELADQATRMSESDWLALQPHFDCSSERWMQSVSLATRQVAFSRYPQDFSAFVRNLVSILSPQVPVSQPTAAN